MRAIFYFLLIQISFSANAQCRMGIATIFNGGDTIEEIASKMNRGTRVNVGKKCIEKLGFDANSDTYCECISNDEKTDFEQSRKAFRQKSGKQLKGAIFEIAQIISNSENTDLTLNCVLNDTLSRSCDQTMIDELFPEYLGKDLGTEIGNDYNEIFNSTNTSINTLNKFRTNICQSSLGNTASVGKLQQEELDQACKKFENEVIGFCKGESLSEPEFDKFDFDLTSTPDIDNFNYFCKIKDRPKRVDISKNILSALKAAHNSLEGDVDPTCGKICMDEAPYSIHGCHVDNNKALAEFKKANCIENSETPDCKFLKEAIGNQLLKDFKSGELNEDDIAFFRSHLHEDDYNELEERIELAKIESSSMKKGSLVSQFFASKDGEALDIGGPEKNEKVAQTPSQNDSSAGSPIAAKMTGPSQQPPTKQAVESVSVSDGISSASVQMASGRSGLRMGTRARSNRNVSRNTKQIVETIKTLRQAGSSLADALSQQQKRLKREREKLARENQDKYQRYDAETLEPIQRGRKGRGPNGPGNYPIANVASTGSGGGSNFATGGAGSSSTGSSTFTQPEAKATVVDITGRSAPNIDLNNLQSSGATLPASITNHPDASEISKMFNGLAYEKDEKGRGIASEKGDVKKIKVSWSAESIDLGSLLINAKDLKPGEEFIVYKGDMDKFVRLSPAYRFQGGKRVFIGYRVENRNRKNADLAASLYAKKFLIL
ncbi:hypothetical protein ACRXCV_11275 [Halobacteriovorax sp. GFR7]|uniref:hypothetical protein n=1 Tax=unclassified Halobacteriovorax TaxID=2639665 RepID=UPI003D95B352